MSLLKKIHDKSILIPYNWINKISFKHTRQNGIEIDIPLTRINKCDQDIFIVISKAFNNMPNHVRKSIVNDKFLKNVRKICGHDY